MTQLTIQLNDVDYKRLEKTASQFGKSVQAMVQEWLTQLPNCQESFDVTQDPVFQAEGYDSDAPSDLAANVDQYLYGEEPIEQMGFTILLQL